MANTYTNLVAHIVFSTKDRRPTLSPNCRDELYAYLGGILRKHGGKAILINGMLDHVHVLTHFPARVALSELVRNVKGGSSSWISDSRLVDHFDGWQTGYAAFTVDPSNRDRLYSYIERQGEHHKGKSYQAEVLEILKEMNVEYDEKYLWD